MFNLESAKLKYTPTFGSYTLKYILLTCVSLLISFEALAADSNAQVRDLLSDPNASVASIESSPYRRSRYFIGGGLGLVAPDENRLVDGLGQGSNAVIIPKMVVGLDFSPRLVFYWEGNYHSFTDKSGFAAYTILTSMGSARINFRRSRGFVPYTKIAAGVAYTNRNLTQQFSSSDDSVTIGEDVSIVFEFGLGLMYDAPQEWLADGDLRLLFEGTSRRDNNDKATIVTYFQETFLTLNIEYLFGSSVFQGDKIIIERDVTTDEGSGDGGIFREKLTPVLYPSAAELAALSDTSKPNIIFFQQYSSYLVDPQKPKLEVIIEKLQENPNLQATITGHADKNDFIYDKIERLKFNRSVSAKRSVSIYHYLVSKGVDPERITLQWRADQRTVTKGNTAEERSLNRRADIVIR